MDGLEEARIWRDAGIAMASDIATLVEAAEALLKHCQPGALLAEGIARPPRQKDIDALMAAITKARGK